MQCLGLRHPAAAGTAPTKEEQGDPAVSLEIYAAVLFSLG